MTQPRTDYETFQDHSPRTRRLLREEELILEITEAISLAMLEDGLSITDMARRLRRPAKFVSDILAGKRPLTMRALAVVADALGRRPRFLLQKEGP